MKESERNIMEDQKKCPECGSNNIITDPEHAEIYCADCGEVIEENIIDLGPEWRAFDSEQIAKKARTGPPATQIHGLGTKTPVLQSVRLPKDWRISKGADKKGDRKKTLDLGYNEIERMTSELRLPNDIKERAVLLFKKAAEKNLIKGWGIEAIVSALIYFVCREYRIPRTSEEIVEKSKVEAKKIKSASKHLDKNKEEIGLKIVPVTLIDLVPRFCSLLCANNETRQKAIEISKEAEKHGLTANGQSIEGLAATVIYMAADLNKNPITYRDIYEIIGISGPTIRSRRNELLELPRQKGEKIETRSVSMKELVMRAKIENNIQIDDEGIEAAIQIGIELEEREEKEHKKQNKKMTAKKNRKATAATALFFALEIHKRTNNLSRPLIKEVLSSAKRSVVEKRIKEIKEFGILDNPDKK